MGFQKGHKGDKKEDWALGGICESIPVFEYLYSSYSRLVAPCRFLLSVKNRVLGYRYPALIQVHQQLNPLICGQMVSAVKGLG